MGDLVNLKRFKKRAEREQSAKQAEANRARFGRTKSERILDEQRAKRASESAGSASDRRRGRIMKSPVVKRSIVVAGHKTSVSLEEAFWNGMKEISGLARHDTVRTGRRDRQQPPARQSVFRDPAVRAGLFSNPRAGLIIWLQVSPDVAPLAAMGSPLQLAVAGRSPDDPIAAALRQAASAPAAACGLGARACRTGAGRNSIGGGSGASCWLTTGALGPASAAAGRGALTLGFGGSVVARAAALRQIGGSDGAALRRAASCVAAGEGIDAEVAAAVRRARSNRAVGFRDRSPSPPAMTTAPPRRRCDRAHRANPPRTAEFPDGWSPIRPRSRRGWRECRPGRRECRIRRIRWRARLRHRAWSRRREAGHP